MKMGGTRLDVTILDWASFSSLIYACGADTCRRMWYLWIVHHTQKGQDPDCQGEANLLFPVLQYFHVQLLNVEPDLHPLHYLDL